MISVFIFTSNDFRPWKIEEREREKEQEDRLVGARIQPDRIGARRSHHSDCSNPPSSNPVTDHRDHLAISGQRAKRETEKERRESREIVAPPARSSRHRSRTHSHQIADEPTRTTPIAPRRRTHHSNEPIHQTHHSDEWVFFHSDRAIDDFFFVGFCLEAKKM